MKYVWKPCLLYWTYTPLAVDYYCHFQNFLDMLLPTELQSFSNNQTPCRGVSNYWVWISCVLVRWNQPKLSAVCIVTAEVGALVWHAGIARNSGSSVCLISIINPIMRTTSLTVCTGWILQKLKRRPWYFVKFLFFSTKTAYTLHVITNAWWTLVLEDMFCILHPLHEL